MVRKQTLYSWCLISNELDCNITDNLSVYYYAYSMYCTVQLSCRYCTMNVWDPLHNSCDAPEEENNTESGADGKRRGHK